MAHGIVEGYATAGTDTGHVGNNAAFAIGHPEKVIDLGYRSVHEMTVQAKSLINSFYGRRPAVLDLERLLARAGVRASPRRFAIRTISTASSPARRR